MGVRGGRYSPEEGGGTILAATIASTFVFLRPHVTDVTTRHGQSSGITPSDRFGGYAAPPQEHDVGTTAARACMSATQP